MNFPIRRTPLNNKPYFILIFSISRAPWYLFSISIQNKMNISPSPQKLSNFTTSNYPHCPLVLVYHIVPVVKLHQQLNMSKWPHAICNVCTEFHVCCDWPTLCMPMKYLIRFFEQMVFYNLCFYLIDHPFLPRCSLFRYTFECQSKSQVKTH